MVDILWLFCDWVGVKKEGKRRRKKKKTRENRRGISLPTVCSSRCWHRRNFAKKVKMAGYFPTASARRFKIDRVRRDSLWHLRRVGKVTGSNL